MTAVKVLVSQKLHVDLKLHEDGTPNPCIVQGSTVLMTLLQGLYMEKTKGNCMKATSLLPKLVLSKLGACWGQTVVQAKHFLKVIAELL